MTENEVSEFSDAYANRIKRLEQENKELQTKINAQGWEIEDLNLSLQTTNEQNVKLEAENNKLKDKVEMLDFFYEANGFNKRGLHNSIMIADYINKLEAQVDKMKCCYNCKHTRTEYEHCRTDKYEKEKSIRIRTKIEN